MPVHEEVLAAANRIAAERDDGLFGVDEIVRALPHLNESSVRTHVVSRCCVNAPSNHLHRWPYFRRIARGRYRVEAGYREKPKQSVRPRPEAAPQNRRRDTIHAIIQHDDGFYVAECLEVAVVTQGRTLDEVVENLRQALALHLEDEDMVSLGLADHPRVQLIYDTAIAS